MIAIRTLFIVLAVCCFILAALGVASRVNLVALGLALWLIVDKLV